MQMSYWYIKVSKKGIKCLVRVFLKFDFYFLEEKN